MDIDVEASQEDDDTAAPTRSGSVSSNSEGNEDAMSQLAAAICGDVDNKDSLQNLTAGVTPKKHDPIQAILVGAGVEYTHLNNEVIGSSKVEERLSRRAELADSQIDDVQVFFDSQDQAGLSPGITNGSGGSKFKKNGKPIYFKYHPPADVMKRQFCSMARRYGFPNATEFALVVEGMTQAQRRASLERWYKERRELLLK